MGSMGFLGNPQAFLHVLKAVVDCSNYKFLLFTAGYDPLDAAIQFAAGSSLDSNRENPLPVNKDWTLLYNDRLFCFSGYLLL